METVTVGCRLPNGLRLEVGYSVNNPGVGGAPFAIFSKSKDYAAFTLKGTNQHMLIRTGDNKVVSQLPRQIGAEPYINRGVPKDLWDRWCKANVDSYHLRTKQIFLIPKEDTSTIRAVSRDASAVTPNVLEPIDKSIVMKIDAIEISKRTDD